MLGNHLFVGNRNRIRVRDTRMYEISRLQFHSLKKTPRRISEKLPLSLFIIISTCRKHNRGYRVCFGVPRYRRRSRQRIPLGYTLNEFETIIEQTFSVVLRRKR